MELSQSVMGLSSSRARRGGLDEEGEENEKSSNMPAAFEGILSDELTLSRERGGIRSK
jgi:hypothetical protein